MEKIITKDGSIAEVDGKEALNSLRHTASHIMAQAIKHLYGGADGKAVQLAIGPSIDTGFYYDIDMERKLTDEDLADIEAEMKKIVKQNLKLERSVSLSIWRQFSPKISCKKLQKVDLPVPFSRLTRTRTGKRLIGCI